jgi:hypothetical protein
VVLVADPLAVVLVADPLVVVLVADPLVVVPVVVPMDNIQLNIPQKFHKCKFACLVCTESARTLDSRDTGCRHKSILGLWGGKAV